MLYDLCWRAGLDPDAEEYKEHWDDAGNWHPGKELYEVAELAAEALGVSIY